MIGRRLGPYRITGELARGGMGVVYLAERDDEAFRKQVAIKVVHGGVPTPPSPRVSTPSGASSPRSIIRTSRACSTPEPTTDGAPFVVMEYVEGDPDRRLRARAALPIAERLELFCTVCDAVQYSHQRLVVHRDIKPSNILVTTDGVPKLLDFGIAKLLDPSGAMSERRGPSSGR